MALYDSADAGGQSPVLLDHNLLPADHTKSMEVPKTLLQIQLSILVETLKTVSCVVALIFFWQGF